jgi:hypothetical protein
MFITFVALKVLITLAFRQNNFLVIHQFLGVSVWLWISERLFKRFPRVINRVFHRFRGITRMLSTNIIGKQWYVFILL